MKECRNEGRKEGGKGVEEEDEEEEDDDEEHKHITSKQANRKTNKHIESFEIKRCNS